MDVVRPAGSERDDVASADAAEIPDLDLRPRDTAASAQGGSRRGAAKRRTWPWLFVLVAIVGGIGFIASRAINDATLFYLNTDEAAARKAELGVKRFRLQGTVKPGTRSRTAEGVSFVTTFNGVEVKVDHVGDPPDLFQDCIPVVLEGRWSDTGPAATFKSDFMIVKHTENYDAANADRVKQAEEGGLSPACPTVPVTP